MAPRTPDHEQGSKLECIVVACPHFNKVHHCLMVTSECIYFVILLQLYARRKLFYPPRHNAKYYMSVIKEVRAEAQSAAFKHLVETNFLSKEELEVLRWGKNASGSLPKRLNKSKPAREIYREATAIECLVGYLYTSDMNRLHKVMEHLGMIHLE